MAKGLGFLGDFFSGLGVVGSRLRSSPWLSPKEPREGAAGLGSFLITFQGGIVLPWGEQLLFSVRLSLAGPGHYLCDVISSPPSPLANPNILMMP